MWIFVGILVKLFNKSIKWPVFQVIWIHTTKLFLGGGRTEQKGKRIHGHGQQCGDCWGEGSIRGLNSNGKKFKRLYLFTL